jgi:hypothetical protein
LELAWQCERWHCLPDAGALYQQDAQIMYRMAVCANIYDTLTHLRNATGEQIHNLTDAERRTLRSLIDMGLIFNERS